jgi:cytochrome b pre-mRNA-processing protein 3
MFGWFANRDRERIVARVYGEIVAQARQPVFYATLGVPDTVEHRYEMMVLHVFLLLHRFRDEDARAKDAAQEVCDRFFLEMDRAMREMGVGDLTVPKRMRKIAGLYTARAAAYTEALAQADDVALAAELARTVVAEGEPAFKAERLATYVRETVRAQRDVPAMALIEQRVVFPDANAFSGVAG